MADSPEIRIGDSERAQALDLLGKHFSVGRLTVAEFDERSTRAAAALTRGDLEVLFADLPAPNSDVPDTGQKSRSESMFSDRWREIVVGLTPFVALLLFFAFDSWLWFLLIPAVSIVLYAGRDDDEDDVKKIKKKKNS
ncbi:DUF1707 SHOCT-like domain-containing protein [Rhodococcus chondri]|uniref:DUF1707 domain-containing protein n=1 Tax=Rhodococcus chondri TaxID=3065941 RepID=A0ABU7JR08_9NOCA|nr:DUF1707 domain-containing protein [Rhodococcus sp. CC-R104]MEE2032447.1 DUF1707 domain-containing protein [Rhodococcus sp. CC-R104]